MVSPPQIQIHTILLAPGILLLELELGLELEKDIIIGILLNKVAAI